MQLDGLESIADLAATAADHKDEEEKDELDINSRDFAKYSPQITKLQVQEKKGEWNFRHFSAIIQLISDLPVITGGGNWST